MDVNRCCPRGRFPATCGVKCLRTKHQSTSYHFCSKRAGRPGPGAKSTSSGGSRRPAPRRAPARSRRRHPARLRPAHTGRQETCQIPALRAQHSLPRSRLWLPRWDHGYKSGTPGQYIQWPTPPPIPTTRQMPTLSSSPCKPLLKQGRAWPEGRAAKRLPYVLPGI